MTSKGYTRLRLWLQHNKTATNVFTTQQNPDGFIVNFELPNGERHATWLCALWPCDCVGTSELF